MFSNWLLFNLAEANLSQRKFAQLVNVSQETVSRWITGRHYPQLDRDWETFLFSFVDKAIQSIINFVCDCQSQKYQYRKKTNANHNHNT